MTIDAADLVSQPACHVSSWTAASAVQPYKWAKARPMDPQLVEARSKLPIPTDEQLRDTAFVTLATGDKAAAAATALMQSIRDTNSRVPTLLVLVSRGGFGSSWCDNYAKKTARGRHIEFVCRGAGRESNVTVEDMVNPRYLLAWERMGVKYEVIDPIPDTHWTEAIRGGSRSTWWGMAFNKLRVFQMTQFRKVIWMDSDTMLFHNIDHLMLQPMFTGAVMHECLNSGSGSKLGGSVWVIEPSAAALEVVQRTYSNPIRDDYYKEPQGWEYGDMQVIMYAFGRPSELARHSTPRPYSWDTNLAMTPGMRQFVPFLRAQTEAAWEKWARGMIPDHAMKRMIARGNATRLENGDMQVRALPPEGVWPEVEAELEARHEMYWHPLDVRYEGLAMECRAGAWEDIGPDYFTVHLTCMPPDDPKYKGVSKPMDYESEHAFLTALSQAHPCIQYYLLRWYEVYRRGMAGERFPPPYFEGSFDLADALTEWINEPWPKL